MSTQTFRPEKETQTQIEEKIELNSSLLENPDHWGKMKNAYRRIERELEKQRAMNNSSLIQ